MALDVLQIDEALAAAVVAEIRTTLRGRSVEELLERLAVDMAQLEPCLMGLVGDGRLIWRGRKLYLP